MQLNLDKTQIVIVGKPNIVKSLGVLEVEVRNIKIQSTSECKSLGLIIDSVSLKTVLGSPSPHRKNYEEMQFYSLVTLSDSTFAQSAKSQDHN